MYIEKTYKSKCSGKLMLTLHPNRKDFNTG